MSFFQIKTRIYAGPGALHALQSFPIHRAMLVTDRYFTQSGELQRVTKELPHAEVCVYDAVTSDPSVEQAAEGAKQMLAFGADTLLALGGGSPIDCAKAMKALSEQPLPFLAIPTTSGTGSEVTSFSILTHGKTKLPLVDDALLPDAAILDPVFLEKLPKTLIADAGMDIVSHCLEALCARSRSPFSDALALHALSTVWTALPKSFQGELSVRGDIHAAACMAGAAFNAAGLGACHALSHALGARYHAAHGRLNGILLPAVIRYNAHADPLPYLRAAHALHLSAATETLQIRALIRGLEQLRRALSMPSHLHELGIDPIPELDTIVTDAMQDLCLTGNPRAATPQDLSALVQESL